MSPRRFRFSPVTTAHLRTGDHALPMHRVPVNHYPVRHAPTHRVPVHHVPRTVGTTDSSTSKKRAVERRRGAGAAAIVITIFSFGYAVSGRVSDGGSCVDALTGLRLILSGSARCDRY